MNHMNHGHGLPQAPPPPPPFQQNHPAQGTAPTQRLQPQFAPNTVQVPQGVQYAHPIGRDPASVPQGARFNVTPNIQVIDPEARAEKPAPKAEKAEASLPLNSSGKLEPFYEGFTFTRLPSERGEKPTWSRAIKTAMPVAHQDLAVEVRKQRAKGVVAITLYNGMGNLRKAQVDHLISEKNKNEKDRRLEWKLADIRSEKKKGEITSMQVIVKRILKPDVIQSSTAKTKSPAGGDIIDLNKPEKKPETATKPTVPAGQGQKMPDGVVFGAGNKVYHTPTGIHPINMPAPQIHPQANHAMNPGFPDRGPQYFAHYDAFRGAQPNAHHVVPQAPLQSTHPNIGVGAHHGGPPIVEIIHDARPPVEPQHRPQQMGGGSGPGFAHPSIHQGLHPGGPQPGPLPGPPPNAHPAPPKVMNDHFHPNFQRPAMPGFQAPHAHPKEYHQQAKPFPPPGPQVVPQPQAKPSKKERVQKWRQTVIDSSESESESEPSLFDYSDTDTILTPVSSSAGKDKRKDKHRRDSSTKYHHKRDTRRPREVPPPAPAPVYREHRRRSPPPPLSPKEPKEAKESKGRIPPNDLEEYVYLPAKTLRDGTAEFRRMMAQTADRSGFHRRSDSYGRDEQYPTGGLPLSGGGRYNSTLIEPRRPQEASYASDWLDQRDFERELDRLELERERNRDRERNLNDLRYRGTNGYSERSRGAGRNFDLGIGFGGRHR